MNYYQVYGQVRFYWIIHAKVHYLLLRGKNRRFPQSGRGVAGQEMFGQNKILQALGEVKDFFWVRKNCHFEKNFGKIEIIT